MGHRNQTTSGMVLSIYATCRAQRFSQPLGLDPVVQKEPLMARKGPSFFQA